MEDFSRCVARVLDGIGYSAEIIAFRRSYWQKVGKECHIALCPRKKYRQVVAGSKAEGITSLLESDIDVMAILESAICSENTELLRRQPVSVLQLETRNSPPGYAMLRLSTKRVFDSLLSDSAYHTPSGDMYASSSWFKACIMQKHLCGRAPFHVKRIQGPAFEYSDLFYKKDTVYALRGYSQTVLHTFKSRRRQSDWPPLDVLTDDSTVTCQLVPVGMKGSSDQWLEWRFCFIETELKLTYSFNDTQLKMYIILKFVAKSILAVITTEISSYIMKNIVYWISERHGTNVFREENIVQLTMLSLHFLMVCVKRNNLPYYMIPARNLLAERLERQTRRQISEELARLLDEGPRLFLRINRLRTGLTVMYASPATPTQYRNTRNRREMLLLTTLYCGLRHRKYLPAAVLNLASSLLPEFRMQDYDVDDLIYVCREVCKLTRTYEDLENICRHLSTVPAFRNTFLFIMERLKA